MQNAALPFRLLLIVALMPLYAHAAADSPRGETPELILQVGHDQRVTMLSWASRAPVLASGSSAAGVVRLWNTRSWELTRVLRVGTTVALGDSGEMVPGVFSSLRSLTLSPDGHLLACMISGKNNTARVEVWSVLSGLRVRTLSPPDKLAYMAPENAILAFLPDNKRLMVGGLAQTELWDVHSAKLIRRYDGFGSLAVSANGRRLATEGLSADKRMSAVILWDVDTGRRVRTFADKVGVWGSAAFSLNGRYIATAGEDPEWHYQPRPGPSDVDYAHYLAVKLWDVRTGRRIVSMRGAFNEGNSEGQSLFFSPDGGTLASATDMGVDFYAVPTGRLRRRLLGRLENGVVGMPVAFSPDGRQLVSDDLYVWNARVGGEGKLLQRLPLPAAAILALNFSPDGKRLATLADNGAVVGRVWDMGSGRQLQALAQVPSYVSRYSPGRAALPYIAFSSHGIVASDGSHWTARLVPQEGGGHPHPVLRPDPLVIPDEERRAVDGAGGVVLMPNGDTLLGWPYTGNALRVRDAKTGALRRTIIGFDNPPHQINGVVGYVLPAPDSTRVVSVEAGVQLNICRLDTGAVVHIPASEGWELPLVFSPDGTMLAATNHQRDSVLLWNTDTGQRIRTLKVRRNVLVGDPQQPNLLRPGAEPVREIAFSADGMTLAVGGIHQVTLHDALTGQTRRTFTDADHILSALAFTPDGKRLAAGDKAGAIKVWDIASGHLQATLVGLPAVKSGAIAQDWIAYTPSGYYDASPGAARLMRWRVGRRLLPAKSVGMTRHRPALLRKALAEQSPLAPRPRP